jgi:hypothetical protein
MADHSVSQDYDVYMSYIEWYISVRKGEESAEGLYEYYRGISRHYFNVLKKFINSSGPTFEYDKFHYITRQPHLSEELNYKILHQGEDVPLSPSDKHLYKIAYSRQSIRLEYIRKNMNMYEAYFKEIVEKMVGKKYDVRKVLAPFLFTASLACLNIFPPHEITDEIADLLGITKRPDNIFPLVNETGEFTLNTYMYAVLNNVELLGIPSGEVSFDGTRGCPATFLRHDSQHNGSMMGKVFSRMSVDYVREKIYYPMFQKIDDVPTKQLVIFSLWLSVHEAYAPVFRTEDINEMLSEFVKVLLFIYKHAHLFLETIDYFYSLLTDDDDKMINGVLSMMIKLPGRPIAEIIRGSFAKDDFEIKRHKSGMPGVFVVCKGLVTIADDILGMNIGQLGLDAHRRNPVNLYPKILK